MQVEIIPFKMAYAIKDDWIRLSANHTVFQSFEWNQNYQKIKWGGRNFVCVAKDYTEKTIAILPITVFKKLYTSKVIILGKNNYVDYGDLISETVTDEMLTAIVTSIKKKFKNSTIELQGIIENTELQKILAIHSYQASEYNAVAVRIPLDVAEYNACLSKSTRQNLRTALNRINKDNLTYKYEIHEGAINNILAEKLVELHLKRNLEKNLKDSRLHNQLRKIKQKVVERYISVIPIAMQTYKNSWFLLVYLNDVIVGYLYGLRENNTIRVLQNCVDSDYKRYSPVFRASYDYITREAVEEHLEWLDFTSGNEDYKYKLNGEEIRLYSYKIK